jgi:hypothetical protein
MSKRLLRTAVWSIVGVCAIGASLLAAEPPSGSYVGDRLSVDLSSGAGRYTGTIHLGAADFPMKATADAGGQLTGTFASDGKSYNFTASLQGDVLTLVSDGATYTMKRQAPTNPLAKGPQQAVAPAPNPQQQPAAPEQPADVPKGYALVRQTNFGKAMTTAKTETPNVERALEAVMDDLDDFFDDDWDITGSYEDQRSHQSGMATISAKHKGQPVHGFIATRLHDKGSTSVVVFCNANATRAQWAELTGAGAKPTPGGPAAPANAPAQGSGVMICGVDAAELQAAVAQVQLKEYRFPDNTGSVGLPDGWRTNARSCQTTVEINGPAGQLVYLGGAYTINTPNSTIVQMARQYGNGGQAMLVADFCEPAEAVERLAPQMSAIARALGKPALEVDHITKLKDLPPMLPNSHFAVVSYGITMQGNGRPQHFQSLAQVSTAPVTNQSWQFWYNQAICPDETARQDMPAMIAIINSWRTNDQAINAKTQEDLNARKQWFDAQQKGHRDQVAAFDQQNEAWRQRSAAQERTAADFDETIRGYREVKDTRTGETASVNLGSADDVVQALNADDPGRYKQIPLRDKVAP